MTDVVSEYFFRFDLISWTLEKHAIFWLKSQNIS